MLILRSWIVNQKFFCELYDSWRIKLFNENKNMLILRWPAAIYWSGGTLF